MSGHIILTVYNCLNLPNFGVYMFEDVKVKIYNNIAPQSNVKKIYSKHELAHIPN